MTISILFSVVIVLFLGNILGCKSSPSETKEFRIGVVLSLTGKGATYGQRALNGMQLAVDELNKSDPFASRPIKLRVEDSQSLSQQALSAFRKLIDIDKVPIAIGFVLSDEVLTCAPVANERGVVILTTAAGSDKIKDAGDYIFRNRESGSLQAQVIADACFAKFGISGVAILHSNAANGISYRDAFKSAFEQLGGKITQSIGYNEGKNEYRAEIEVLKAKAPKAVYLAGLDQEMGLILKQSFEVGFSPKFFSSAGAISEKLLEIAGQGAEGLVCGSASFNIESKDPNIYNFVNTYRLRFGDKPDFIAANSYDAVKILSEYFKRGVTNSEEIKNALYNVKDYLGVGGLTTFDRSGEVTRPIELVIVENGRFTPIKTFQQ